MAKFRSNPRRLDAYKKFQFRLRPRFRRPSRDEIGVLQDQLALLDQMVEQERRLDLLGDGRTSGSEALFVGRDREGKAIAAEVIADDLGRDLYRVDLSMIVSRYIGETEEHLDRIFDAAERSGAVLFFAEADALFGKRTGVSDSHDRYANLEISYLLRKLEHHKGLAIFATSSKENIDQAFTRRLRFVIDFPYPGK